MARNVVLVLATLLALGAVLGGYALWAGRPAEPPPARPTMRELPPQVQPPDALQLGGNAVTIPPGGEVLFRVFDERTGRPTDMLRCRDWSWAGEGKREIRVSEPVLAKLLPSGMIATITADEGQFIVERIEQSQLKPKLGWLAGHVRIEVDRATSVERTPAVERPEDLITVALERIEFDLELGELKSPGLVTVASDDFEVVGTGLHLVWNQADNRVETLTIEQGEQFVLYTAAGLISGAGDTAAASQAASAPAGPAPADPARADERGARPRGRTTSYACTLTGGIAAEQRRGDEPIGGLWADDLRLIFDVGGGAGQALRRDGRDRATSRPDHENGDRLIVRWRGQLELGPTAGPRTPAEGGRRQIVATGRPLVLTRRDGEVRCARLEYHDETQRVWLEPEAGNVVQFSVGPRLTATAQSVYVDRAERSVKLLGDVELRSRRGDGPDARVSTLRSSYWAELRVAAGAEGQRPADGPALEFGRLEAGQFVGDVHVDLGPQRLVAHRLDVSFRPGAEGESLEELLDGAVAWGDVKLSGDDGELRCGQLELAFALNAQRAPYPRWMEAFGSVRIVRDRTRIAGDRIIATLAAPADDATGRPPRAAEAKSPLFVLRTLDIVGRADLFDPENKVAARAAHIRADFVERNRLTTAAVVGGDDGPGLVHAQPYTVRGGRIDLDRDAQTLRVAGPARLSLKTQRSLQGERRGAAVPIVVRSERRLEIDGRNNSVRFEGDVVAVSGDERLTARTLTLLLEDVPDETPAAPPPSSPWSDLYREARRLAGAGTPDGGRGELLEFGTQPGERQRKEPVRLVAEDAVVASEVLVPGDEQPLTHASIAAPQLAVDIVNRTITTDGTTRLLLLDRRGFDETEAAREVAGLPSALVSRGPSQTAMQCAGRMTYTLGAEGPQRRDAVVFERDVLLVHRAGREMVNLAEMLPQVSTRPELLETLQSRNTTLECDRLECWFVADERAGGSGTAGGPLTRAPLRLTSLTAQDGVYVRDQQGPRIREINAAWVEFDREQSRVQVRGDERAVARVYVQDSATGQFDAHTGQHWVINLEDGTIRAGPTAGQIGRP